MVTDYDAFDGATGPSPMSPSDELQLPSTLKNRDHGSNKGTSGPMLNQDGQMIDPMHVQISIDSLLVTE